MENRMKTVTVKGKIIGEGMPKIVVPLVAETVDGILAEVAGLRSTAAELAEWRVDFFEGSDDADRVCAVLPALSAALEGIPLLVTFRTAQEGGARDISPERYAELLTAVCKTGFVDLLDVELQMGDEVFSAIRTAAHREQVFVLASNHDFQKTPPKEELIARLCRMQKLEADILKIAVMPQSKQDVLTLLSATEEMVRRHATCPVVTMSMGQAGMISRICGEVFGSALTFGAANKTSAPGQLPVGELASILQSLHSEGGMNQ